MAAVDPGQKCVTIATDREITFNPGDLLTFYAQDTERLGTQTITKMYSVEEPNEISGKTSEIATDFKYDDADFMKVRSLAPSSESSVTVLLRRQPLALAAACSC